jgi:hypothetical protein
MTFREFATSYRGVSRAIQRANTLVAHFVPAASTRVAVGEFLVRIGRHRRSSEALPPALSRRIRPTRSRVYRLVPRMDTDRTQEVAGSSPPSSIRSLWR